MSHTLFQSTLPRGERQLSIIILPYINVFQSTLPRGERPGYVEDIGECFIVSIHAPAWGATKKGNRDFNFMEVSIHAPAWGATRIIETYPDACSVSIHAPAWGATWNPLIIPFSFTCFNPRSRVGSDPGRRSEKETGRGFNPRSRVGSDWQNYPLNPPHKLFQSTLPRGERRPLQERSENHENVSIHAPAWGATYKPMQSNADFLVSIHAPAWGATCRTASGEPYLSSFNPRSRVGSDSGLIPVFVSNNPFQSTLPRGERHFRNIQRCQGQYVSIHAPAWGATCI